MNNTKHNIIPDRDYKLEENLMNKELKKAIINWLLDNENRWQRINECIKEFREYIYNSYGNYLIGGQEVLNFIDEADSLLYPRTKL